MLHFRTKFQVPLFDVSLEKVIKVKAKEKFSWFGMWFLIITSSNRVQVTPA